MTESVDDVAAAVLAGAGPTTTMKLQKLVYYCQAWHLAHHGKPMFADTVEAWKWGPVVFNLWCQHRGSQSVTRWPSGDSSRLENSSKTVIQWVVERYGRLDADELSRLTHLESPWLNARHGLPDEAWARDAITHEDMAAYYGRQIMADSAALAESVASAALEGVEIDQAWQDVMADVLAGRRDAGASIAELVARLSGD